MINLPNASVTILRAGTRDVDDYGNPITETLTETLQALVGWGSTGTDFGAERETTSQQGTIYFDASVIVPSGTEFVISGKKYRMTGEQTRWAVPQGWELEAGSVVEIERITG